MVPVRINSLSFYYNRQKVLKNINIDIKRPGFYTILGPNGSGKTTLLYNILGIFKPYSGKIELYGEDIRKKGQKELARLVAFVPQRYSFRYPFKVREVLAMGRYPYLSLLDFDYKEDKHRVYKIAEYLGIKDLLERPVTALSGGQLQRVVIGKALIQDTPIYLLDEPISSLDIKYKLRILNYFKKLSREKVIITAFHELELVGFYSDEVIFLKDGEVFEKGKTDRVFTSKNIKDVFDIDVIIRRENILKMDINWEVLNV